MDWLKEAKINRLGAFQYEAVKGAVANDLGLEPVEEAVKKSRYDRLMRQQQGISTALLKQKIGRHMPVIIDRADKAGIIGRTKGDAPEIDGVVKIASRRPLRVGEVVSVKVTGAEAYDLAGVAG